MPQNSRQNTKQHLAAVLRELNTAQEKIVVTAQPFKEVHPEYYIAFEDIVTDIEKVKMKVEYLKNKI